MYSINLLLFTCVHLFTSFRVVIKARTATPPLNHLGSASQICFVNRCTSDIRDRERKEHPNKPFHFHRIPKDEASRALWVKAIGDAVSLNVESKVFATQVYCIRINSIRIYPLMIHFRYLQTREYVRCISEKPIIRGHLKDTV